MSLEAQPGPLELSSGRPEFARLRFHVRTIVCNNQSHEFPRQGVCCIVGVFIGGRIKPDDVHEPTAVQACPASGGIVGGSATRLYTAAAKVEDTAAASKSQLPGYTPRRQSEIVVVERKDDERRVPTIHGI